MDKRPIGMFDSGVGGMTVFSEIIKNMPNEDIIYLGDSKRFPYGSKSKETIIEISKEAVRFLISKNVKAIVVACGTATSQALEELKKEFTIPIIGIIHPTIEYIKKNQNLRKIGVIATKGTIRSNAWEKELKKEISNIEVENKACPILAQVAEEGWTNNEIAKLIINEYLKDVKNIDALILGCTHYPLFKDIIQAKLGKQVELIDTGEKLSNYLKSYLEENNLYNEKLHKGEYEIYLTDTESNFTIVANRLLSCTYKIENEEIKKIEF